jgi:hypothetical protein
MSDPIDIDAIDGVEGRDINELSGAYYNNLDSQNLVLDRGENPGHIIYRTKDIANAFITPPLPFAGDRSLTGRVTTGAVEEVKVTEKPTIVKTPIALTKARLLDYKHRLRDIKGKLTQIEEKLSAPTPPGGPNPPEPHELKFPNFALEAVLAGLAKERQTNETLKKHIETAEGYQKDIDLLLDLSAELTKLKGEENEVPARVKELLIELDKRGIHLEKGEGLETVTKEQIAELKSLSSAQMDKLRSNLQILFTTKIQFLIQAISAILECVKDMIRNDARLKGKTNTIQR